MVLVNRPCLPSVRAVSRSVSLCGSWSGRINGVAGWKRWAVALITLVAGATVIVLAWRSPGGLESAARIGALIVGLAPLALSLIVWAR